MDPRLPNLLWFDVVCFVDHNNCKKLKSSSTTAAEYHQASKTVCAEQTNKNQRQQLRKLNQLSVISALQPVIVIIVLPFMFIFSFYEHVISADTPCCH